MIDNAPVNGPFEKTTLLIPEEIPEKLTTWLALDQVCADVAATETAGWWPGAALARTALDDDHAVCCAALPPTRARAVRSTVPTDDTATVTLTEPVVGPLVDVTELTASDAPA